MSVHAFAALKPKAKLTPFAYDEKVGADDVLIKVTHCGICHSDVHIVDGDWGDACPCVPGHEIVGEVESGKGFKKGERVGVGWQADSCGTCEWCLNAHENDCPKQTATAMGHYGGFADKVVVNKRFVFKLPKELDSASAAPLLCGGVTVYSPLKKYAKRGAKVGVIGIGGLGHLAIQFASKMGCDVTAMSHTKEKEAEAKSFGAKTFTVDKPKPGSFDVIVSTIHSKVDMVTYLKALRPNGVFVQVGAAPEPLVIPAMSLIGGEKAVAGSAIGSPKVIAEMLAFAAKHNVAAKVEVLPMQQCNEALDKTRKGQAPDRGVLKNERGGKNKNYEMPLPLDITEHIITGKLS